jgi:hypothetical protein
MWFADLAPCTYFPQGGLTAVGWLEADHPYPQGEVDPDCLPELVTQSVFSDKFPVRIASLSHLSRTRARQGVAAVATEWHELLDTDAVASRSALAHKMGVSRARVSQVLGPAASGAGELALR